MKPLDELRPGVQIDLVRAVDGAPPRWPTTVTVAWDPAALFIHFRCRDDLAWATHRVRDAPLWQEEVVEVFLAPVPAGAPATPEPPTAYVELEVNPLGALFDAWVENPDGDRATMRVDTAWDWPGIAWRAGVDRDRDDWWASLELPWRGLVADREALPTRWFANFYRVERPDGAGAVDRDEYSAWSPTWADPPNFHRPEHFGILTLDGAASRSEPGPSSSRPWVRVPRIYSGAQDLKVTR